MRHKINLSTLIPHLLSNIVNNEDVNFYFFYVTELYIEEIQK